MGKFIDLDEHGEPVGWHPWNFVLLILGICIVSYAIGWVSLGEQVMTAGIRGQAAAHIQKESAGNRIAAQRRFVDDLSSIVKFNQQYDDALQAVIDFDVANAGKQDNAIGTLANQRQDLVKAATGYKDQCQNVVNDYAEAGAEYLSSDFKDAGYPDTIGIKEFCQSKLDDKGRRVGVPISGSYSNLPLPPAR